MTIDQLLQSVGATSLVQAWYNWGAFVGLVVAGLVAFWIFYDAPRRMLEATLWKVLSIVAAILVIPSVVFRLAPSLAYPSLLTAVTPVAYLGLVGAVLGLIAVALYTAGVGTRAAYTCPQCGRPLDPSWDRCPYCEPEPVSPPPPPPTERIEPQPVEPSPVIPARETEILVKLPPELAWLVVTSGPRTGKEFRLGEATSIGRDATQNDVVIDDEAMSRQHAKVKLERKQFVLHDLGSSNGTFVNDRRIYRQILSDGDKVRMGETDFTFKEVKEKKETGKARKRGASRAKKQQKSSE